MFKYRIIVAVLLLAVACAAQTTSVTLQVTDTDVQTWNNGAWTATLVSPPGVNPGPYVIAGASTPVPNQLQTGSLSASGGASFTVTPNTSIAPAGTQWQFKVCPQASPSPCFTQSFTIIGASQTITLTPPGIRISIVNPTVIVSAYQDLEIIGQSIGAAYFNLTSLVSRQWNGTAWQVGGGVTPPGGSPTQIQFNSSGAFGGDSNLTWNNSTKQFQYGTSVGPPTFSIASNAFITGFPLVSAFNTTTDTTSTVNGPLDIPTSLSMDINPATGSQTTEAWTLNALAYTDPSNSTTFLNELVGMHGEFDHRGSGLVTNGYGLSGEDFVIGTGGMTFETGVLGNSGTWTGSSGNVNTAQGLVGLVWNAGSGTITNGYGVHVFAHTTGGATGLITNMTGLQIDDINVTGVTNPLAINVAANDSNLGPGHVKMGIAQITAAANDSAPPLNFQAGGFTTNVPGCEANGLATSSAILYCVINGVKLTALDFNFGLTMVNQSGLGFASSGLSRNSGFWPLGAASIAVGNGAASDVSGKLTGGALQFPSLLAGVTASGTNNVGVDLTLQSSNGTGNATPSHIKLVNPGFSSTSGTTLQSPVTTYIVHKKAGSTTSGTATNMFQIPVAANQTIGAEIIVHVETTQATPQNCSTTETFVAAVQNTSSTVTQQTTAGTTATICSTGTLTLTAAFSTATPSVFSVTPSWTTIVPTAVIISVEIHNLSQQDITTL